MEKIKNIQKNKGTSISRANIEEKAENNVGAGLDQPDKENVSMKNVGAWFHPCPQKNKGITLIALIITIIVMLILVAVSIQVLFNTGLFESAGKATQKWNAEQEKESNMQITIGNKTYGSVEDYISGKDEPEPTDSKYFKITYDENNKTASIDGIKEQYCMEYTYFDGEVTYDNVTKYVPCYIKDGETKIIDIVIPKIVEKDGVKYEVKSISTYAFSNYIDNWGYAGESEWRSIYIPNSVARIEHGAFYNCSSLISINIPNSVTSLGNGAFRGCSSLTSIEIPDSVTSIGAYAFYGCSSLTDVYYTGSEEDWAKISIGSSNTLLTSANITYNYTGE